jgi:hypothetical protein
MEYIIHHFSDAAAFFFRAYEVPRRKEGQKLFPNPLCLPDLPDLRGSTPRAFGLAQPNRWSFQ